MGYIVFVLKPLRTAVRRLCDGWIPNQLRRDWSRHTDITGQIKVNLPPRGAEQYADHWYFSMADINLSDVTQLLAEVQTSQGKDIAKVYKTPNKDHQYEIRTVGASSKPDRVSTVHGNVMETKESIRSSVDEFLDSIDHPDSDSDLHVDLV